MAGASDLQADGRGRATALGIRGTVVNTATLWSHNKEAVIR